VKVDGASAPGVILPHAMRPLLSGRNSVTLVGTLPTAATEEEQMAKYGSKTQDKVRKVMHEKKEGKLRSGGSHKKVTSRKQAIAIALSEARREGDKSPPNPNRKSGAKKSSAKKSSAKKSSAKKSSSRKSAAKKSTKRTKPTKSKKKSSAKKSSRKKSSKK
jgi:hypothetical protein